MPGNEAWLIGERRTSGEHKNYLSNLSAQTSIRVLASTIKARWICGQAHQQLREDWTDHAHGPHPHAHMTMIAYAFLQSRRIATAKQKNSHDNIFYQVVLNRNSEGIGQFLWRQHILQLHIVRQAVLIRWISFAKYKGR